MASAETGTEPGAEVQKPVGDATATLKRGAPAPPAAMAAAAAAAAAGEAAASLDDDDEDADISHKEDGKGGFLRARWAFFGLWKITRPCKIVVVGLDASGKTTLINHMKPKKMASYEVTPTVGLTEEHFVRGKLSFHIFDMAGDSKYRSMWESYYEGVDAVIFVIDSSAKIRMVVAKDEMENMLRSRHIASGGALEPPDVMAQLGLHEVKDHPWHVQASNALTGEGIDQALRWLTDQLEKEDKKRQAAAKAAGGAKKAAPAGAAAGGAGSGGGGGGGGASSAAASETPAAAKR